MKAASTNYEQRLDLAQEFSSLMEEARTIMPGIQALFGFQLIAVFNQTFTTQLDDRQRAWHLAAIGLSALAAGLATCPATLHRQACPEKVTSRLTTVATMSLASALLPLALAISIDFWLVADLVIQNHPLALALGIGLFAILITLWYLIPQLLKKMILEGAEPCEPTSAESMPQVSYR